MRPRSACAVSSTQRRRGCFPPCRPSGLSCSPAAAATKSSGGAGTASTSTPARCSKGRYARRRKLVLEVTGELMVVLAVRRRLAGTSALGGGSLAPAAASERRPGHLRSVSRLRPDRPGETPREELAAPRTNVAAWARRIEVPAHRVTGDAAMRPGRFVRTPGGRLRRPRRVPTALGQPGPFLGPRCLAGAGLDPIPALCNECSPPVLPVRAGGN